MQTFLRLANELDAPAIREIYAPYCEVNATSFELFTPPVEEIQARLRKVTAQYPWLVYEREGEVLGYAYAGTHRERAAYRWVVEVAVYVAAGSHRQGVGRTLYTALFRALKLQGYYKAYAGITLPNPGSVGLHESLGFTPLVVFPEMGYKLGAWHDVGWWELALQTPQQEPAEPRKVGTLSAAEWGEIFGT